MHARVRASAAHRLQFQTGIAERYEKNTPQWASSTSLALSALPYETKQMQSYPLTQTHHKPTNQFIQRMAVATVCQTPG